jgi:hypothetical protein
MLLRVLLLLVLVRVLVPLRLVRLRVVGVGVSARGHWVMVVMVGSTCRGARMVRVVPVGRGGGC